MESNFIIQNTDESKKITIYYLKSVTYIKIQKPFGLTSQSKLLILTREIANLSYVSQCNNATRLAQSTSLLRFLQSAKTLQSKRLDKCLIAPEFSHGMQS